MENKNQIQLRTSSSLPAIDTVDSIVAIRLDEAHYPHYRNIPLSERTEWLVKEIRMLAELVRLRDFGAKEAIIMAAALDEMLLRHPIIADLTLPEMHDAFKCGVFGIYKEFRGLSAPNLYGFASDYLGTDKKKRAVELVIKEKNRQYAANKQAEYEMEQRKIRAEIEEAKKNGTYVPTGGGVIGRKMYDEAEVAAHREKVRRQADAILRPEKEGSR